MNSNTSQINDEFFKLLLMKYPHLDRLSLKDNVLKYEELELNLNKFKLINLNKNALCFSLKPYDFFNLVKIHVDIFEENEYIKKEGYNENTIYLEIQAIIFKDVIDEHDIVTLTNFISAYKSLNSYQDYLLNDAFVKLNKMSSFINNLLTNPYVKETQGILLLHSLMMDSSSKEKTSKLILTNPNFPSIINEDNLNVTKNGSTGYASILLLLYVVINIGFILAIILLK